jgi:hypothetical protein
MSESNDFYLTLMSNSSFDQFPDNKTTNFTVSLPKTVRLVEGFSVALTELHFLNTFDNVTSNNNRVMVDVRYEDSSPPTTLDRQPVKRFYYNATEGYYSNIFELIIALNREIKKYLSIKEDLLHYEEKTQKIFVPEKSYNAVLNCFIPAKGNIAYFEILLEGYLALQLGFDPEQCIYKKPARHTPNLSLGIPQESLIYCDIIEPQLYADSYAQVLRTIATGNSNSRYGDVCV